jgi:hypothetical protein
VRLLERKPAAQEQVLLRLLFVRSLVTASSLGLVQPCCAALLQGGCSAALASSQALLHASLGAQLCQCIATPAPRSCCLQNERCIQISAYHPLAALQPGVIMLHTTLQNLQCNASSCLGFRTCWALTCAQTSLCAHTRACASMLSPCTLRHAAGDIADTCPAWAKVHAICKTVLSVLNEVRQH